MALLRYLLSVIGHIYHSCVHSDEDIDEGERFVVSGAYEDSDPGDTDDPLYYCVVRVTYDSHA